mmetsp:Transcript_5769/g.5711  ORF Transcript_5769/g.5711 Transcript_5769/m.5711 type:complete len:150 (-) Transcript_5769:92-541(-)
MSATYNEVGLNKDLSFEDNNDIETEKFVEETTGFLNEVLLLNNKNEKVLDTTDTPNQLSSEDVSYADAINASLFPLQEEKEQSVYTINLWTILKKSSINLILPFINGMMLGFGEILAHEIGFRYNWVGAKVEPPRRVIRKNQQNQSVFL